METGFKDLLLKAKTLVTEMKLAEAAALYQHYLNKSQVTPLDAEEKSRLATVHNNLGQVKYLKVDFPGATEEYSKALFYDPLLAPAYYNRGTIMYRMGDYDRAITDMQKASTLDPTNEEFKTALERAQMQSLYTEQLDMMI